MADPAELLMTKLETWRERIVAHFRRQKWSYIFAAFVWALVWYAMMDLLAYLSSEPQ